MARQSKVWIKADREAIKEILKERDWSYDLLSEKIGISTSTFNDHLNKYGFEPMEFRLLCMILGKSEDELKDKPKVVEEASNVDKILSTNAILGAINELKAQHAQLQKDIESIARVVASIQKTVIENKAAIDLESDDVKAIFNKATEINSTVSKMSAHMGAKYRAYAKNN